MFSNYDYTDDDDFEINEFIIRLEWALLERGQHTTLENVEKFKTQTMDEMYT
jgi:hypothetical protein